MGCIDNLDGMVVVRLKPSIELTTFQGEARAAWRFDSRYKAYTKRRDLQFAGTCSAVSSLAVFVNGASAGNDIPCDKTHKFSWSFSSTQDGEYEVRFEPKISDGSLIHQPMIQTVVVDTVAPPAPVITTRAGNDFIAPRPNVQLAGTVSADTYSIESNAAGSGRIITANSAFVFDTVMAFGETKQFNIYAVDLAGNRSDPDAITVSYGNSYRLAAPGITATALAAAATGSGGTAVLERASSEPMLVSGGPAASAPSGHNLWTGILDRLSSLVDP
jgi:hypothetical protein